MVDAVNAALVLRRPLLLTGRPGSGKSSLIESVARELRLGRVLRWHITSSSTLTDALYRYDAIGRLHMHGLRSAPVRAAAAGAAADVSPPAAAPPIEDYLRLGPLGTALLPGPRPRALLIDEIDKSDIDLPNDLLNAFERGEFTIPELARLNEDTVRIRVDGDDRVYPITRGRVQCTEFPFVVVTSNGERDFSAAFLRRCIRLRMPDPTVELLTEIVKAHLGPEAAEASSQLITTFASRSEASRAYATDQLMNAIFLVTSAVPPEGESRDRVVDLLLKQLTTDLA
jgi:MoxR-like ATPase